MQIEVKNVSFTYSIKTPNSFEALKGVSLGISKGDYVAIVGQTGSGKSTLVQMLNGLALPTSGEVLIDGISTKVLCKKSKSLKQLRKKVGLVFQFPEYQLFEETILKDVAFGLINYGLKKELAYEKAKEYILKIGLDESYFERSPFELSGGEKRKVAIAGILALDPDVIVLDEPTAGLDPKSKADLLNIIEKLHSEGKTIIVVTHSMSLVRKYANHVVMIEDGNKLFDGTPDEFFLNEKVAEIIEIPDVIKCAKLLCNHGAKIDLLKVNSVETLISEISVWRHKNG